MVYALELRDFVYSLAMGIASHWKFYSGFCADQRIANPLRGIGDGLRNESANKCLA